MTTIPASFADTATTSSGIAFGSLIDVARSQRGDTGAEICQACNTINRSSARFCKCCSHKLPAFYASQDSGGQGPQPEARRVIPQRRGDWTSRRSGS